MARTASWAEFEAAAPETAAAARTLFYRGQTVAAAFLATVSPAGTPRLHPVCPVIAGGGLWLFVVNMSPKYRDLVANGRFALHAYVADGGGDELNVIGIAEEVREPGTRASVVAATGGQQGGHEFEALFRCGIAHVLHTKWENWGTAQTWPSFAKWKP